MKVKIIMPSDKWLEIRDWRSYLRIEIDGKEVFFAADGEPEDATILRDFNDCVKIPELMKLAFEAGKKGEQFEIERLKEDCME